MYTKVQNGIRYELYACIVMGAVFGVKERAGVKKLKKLACNHTHHFFSYCVVIKLYSSSLTVTRINMKKYLTLLLLLPGFAASAQKINLALNLKKDSTIT